MNFVMSFYVFFLFLFIGLCVNYQEGIIWRELECSVAWSLRCTIGNTWCVIGGFSGCVRRHVTSVPIFFRWDCFIWRKLQRGLRSHCRDTRDIYLSIANFFGNNERYVNRIHNLSFRNRSVISSMNGLIMCIYRLSYDCKYFNYALMCHHCINRSHHLQSHFYSYDDRLNTVKKLFDTHIEYWDK